MKKKNVYDWLQKKPGEWEAKKKHTDTNESQWNLFYHWSNEFNDGNLG